MAPAKSSLYLPRLDPQPATVLDYLVARFPHVGPDTWRRRMAEGKVTDAGGEPITPDDSYREGITIRYAREMEEERIIPFEERILFRNEHIVIADKPHFLPVTPSGPYVEECLLARLRRRTGLESITPVHRLDRETAGLVIFSVDPRTRPLYHRLFARAAVAKEYLAVGRGAGIPAEELTIANRMEPGEPWFRMRIVEGEPNAVTHVRVISREEDRVLFRVRPETGKKHQIRLHLLSIGYPIVNDRLYPDVHPHAPYDFTDPLQLLAHRLGFVDPVSGEAMEFASERALAISGSRRSSSETTAAAAAADPERSAGR